MKRSLQHNHPFPPTLPKYMGVLHARGEAWRGGTGLGWTALCSTTPLQAWIDFPTSIKLMLSASSSYIIFKGTYTHTLQRQFASGTDGEMMEHKTCGSSAAMRVEAQGIAGSGPHPSWPMCKCPGFLWKHQDLRHCLGDLETSVD